MLNPTPELLATTFVLTIASVPAAFVVMKHRVEAGALTVTGVALMAVGVAGMFWAAIDSRVGSRHAPGRARLHAREPLRSLLPESTMFIINWPRAA